MCKLIWWGLFQFLWMNGIPVLTLEVIYLPINILLLIRTSLVILIAGEGLSLTVKELVELLAIVARCPSRVVHRSGAISCQAQLLASVCKLRAKLKKKRPKGVL